MARPGLEKNPKFRNLLRLLGEPRSHVRGYLDCLWEAAYENGNPVIGDSAMIEATADYPGDAGKLFAALRDCGGEGQVGFIEPVDGQPQRFQIHDLYDHAPEYVKKRMKRELEREAKGVTLSELRAAAGRVSANKRQQTASSCQQTATSVQQTATNGDTPAPAPAPAPKEEHSLSADADSPHLLESERRFVKRWNATTGVVPVRGETLTTARRKRFRARMAFAGWAEGVKPALAKFPLKCFQTDANPWRPDVDWFLKPDSLQAVLEGKYDWSKGNDQKEGDDGFYA